MSDKMTCLPFANLMNMVFAEYAHEGTIFGVHKMYRHSEQQAPLHIFGEALELPFGPAAGPHTQLAQNIIAAYSGGCRFFELKTVQQLDGEDLPVSKPCIFAPDECYNVEWSTELRVPDAMNEYIKAYFALKLIAKEFGLGSADGFVFNISVGYTYDDIKKPKTDAFINGMKNAEDTAAFKECKTWAINHLHLFKNITLADINAISANICRSVTLSTLHGCPPAEIERIASYLIFEKKLNTFVKCNPTLLGYDTARSTLNQLGFDYVSFDEHHFKEDLQFADAVPMLTRLQELALANGLEFGVKLTNTFPVEIKENELPGDEMYMSGRSLFALSLQVVQKLATAFNGTMRIAYSGGADAHNILQLYNVGIWPITVATTLLKPGGYNRALQLAEIVAVPNPNNACTVNVNAVNALVNEVFGDKYYQKPAKPAPSRKSGGAVPLIDCFKAPCQSGCPLAQDIPAYLRLVDEGNYAQALNVILQRNPLPFITGTICAHRCTTKCTRNFYDTSVNIRAAKLQAANAAFEIVLPSLKPKAFTGKKAAVVGGGPAGMAAAYLLAREGVDVTLYEKQAKLGGIVRYVIPEFRISQQAIDNDARLLSAMGVNVRTNTEITSKAELDGFDYIILAIGAWDKNELRLSGDATIDALDFLANSKKHDCNVDIGENVVIIGGGNTAMDAARAAIRADGTKKVRIVYRRSRQFMPADEEELELAAKDGVEFCELLSPIKYSDKILICEKMCLGAADASGRRAPEPTGITIEIPADTVIAAVGEKVDSTLYTKLSLSLDEKGKIVVKSNTSATSNAAIYAIGDGKRGGATVAEGIADALQAVQAITGENNCQHTVQNFSTNIPEIMRRRGVLCEDGGKCLECKTICEACKDVCPNRANVAIKVPGMDMPQILHIDGMCNECGNCAVFCPYDSSPYKDKFTLFWTKADFDCSKNSGFYAQNGTDEVWVRLGDTCAKYNINDINCGVYEPIRQLIITVINNHKHLFL